MISQTAWGDWRAPDEDFLASFRQPHDDEIDPLAVWHPMPRAKRLRFDADTHIYYYDNVAVPRSVTGLLKAYATDFDARRAAGDIMASIERRADYGEGATIESIVEEWSRNGEVQRARGQLLHFYADQLCRSRRIQEPWSPELRQVQHILATLQRMGFRPYRSEVSIYHADLQVAGQPDVLLSDGKTIRVLDWKRIRALEFDSRRSLRPPVEHLPDCNFWRYALQDHQDQEGCCSRVCLTRLFLMFTHTSSR